LPGWINEEWLAGLLPVTACAHGFGSGLIPPSFLVNNAARKSDVSPLKVIVF